MFGSPSKSEYEPLAAHLDGEASDDSPSSSRAKLEYSDFPDTSSKRSWSLILPKPIVYGCVLIAVLSVLNAALLPMTITKYKDMTPSNEEINALPYPDQHLGLQRLRTKPKPFGSHSSPTNIVRLSQNLKNAVYGDSPQVFISVQDSTLMRFEIPSSESGTGACALTFTAPPENTSTDIYGTKGDITEVEVWKVLRQDDDIPWGERSQNRRPPRGEILGTMNFQGVKHNVTTEDFECPEDELVVELRCLRVACEVQFQQSNSWPKFGFELARRV